MPNKSSRNNAYEYENGSAWSSRSLQTPRLHRHRERTL